MTIGNIMQQEIASAAQRYNLPAPLISAIVMTESAGDLFAWKSEPKFRYLVDCTTGKPFRPLTKEEILSEIAPGDFPCPSYSSRDTEWWGQQASWGPMQVMGALARELGFKQPFPALCTLAYGIDFGARYLAILRDRHLKEHGWRGVAAAYNAGSPRYASPGVFKNQEYVDRVASHRGFNFEEVA